MGVAGGLAGHGAQAEAAAGVVIGALQPAVVEDEALRLPVFEKELAVVGALESAGEHAARLLLAQAGTGNQIGRRIAHRSGPAKEIIWEGN